MKIIRTVLVALALSLAAATAAAQETAESRSAEPARADSRSMLEEAELAREEAEAARAEAARVAEMARETARTQREIIQRQAELAREEEEMVRAKEAELERELERNREEMERAREELSRAHRELREASREVASAHRELSHDSHRRIITRRINLGDRAVIGVVLGKQADEGVEIIGVSPDGPAERAGLQQGDVLLSIGDVELAGVEQPAQLAIREIMDDVQDGEELVIVAQRDGIAQEFTLTAERREPRGWQSMIRIPEIEVIEGHSGEAQVIVETIEIPDIDEVALAERVEALTESLKTRKLLRVSPDHEDFEHFEVEIGEFSDFGDFTMGEASVWFGLPHAQGLELAEIGEGLGRYFETDRGVLVIRAREGNAYQLEPGDVILEIDANPVDSPADLMRALREVEPGSEIEISIKRDRRDETLVVAVPDKLLGFK